MQAGERAGVAGYRVRHHGHAETGVFRRVAIRADQQLTHLRTQASRHVPDQRLASQRLQALVDRASGIAAPAPDTGTGAAINP